MGGKKTSSILNRKGLVLWLTGFTILYQVVYQAFMMRVLRQELEDEECHASGSGAGASPHCVEVRLFHDWQQQEAHRAQASNASDTHGGLSQLAQELASSLAELKTMESELTAGFNHWDEIVTGGLGRENLTVASAQSHDEWEKAVKRLSKAEEAESKSRQRLEQKKRALEEAQRATEEAEEASLRFAAGAAFRATVTAETARWQEAFQQRAEESASWSRRFSREVRAEQREMCQEAHRRNRSDCIELLASIADAERRESQELRQELAARATLRANTTAEAAHWEVALRRSSRTRAADQRGWERELLAQYGVPSDSLGPDAASRASTTKYTEQAEMGSTSLRQGRRPLHWSDVAGWSSTGWLSAKLRRSKGRLLLDRPALQAARWAGMIPKVACIAAIRFGPTVASQMKYFINRFRQQTYEGPSQLILVHHYKDTEAADLARLYADGSYIKAVSARDDGEFPSATALRFGAWSADDPQVVVQWNFDEWHHPERLSLQVRALAYSSRPGCLLRDRSTAEGSLQEESLAGEAKWMHKQWHPLLASQQAVLLAMQEDQIVQVNTTMDGGRHEADPAAAIRGSMDEHFARLAKLLGGEGAPGAK